MLISPEAVLRIGKLTPEDFAHQKHRAVFEAAVSVVDRGVPLDTITLEAELGRRGTLSGVGGFAGLSGYLVKVPTADNAAHYAAIIRDGALGRRLRLAASGAATRLGAGADWQGELVGLRRALEELEESAHTEPPTLREAMEEEIVAIESRSTQRVGLKVGLGIERVVPTGLPLDKVTTVFAETGHLKTTFVSNLAWRIAAGGDTVLNISWEDSTQLGAQRALGRTLGMNYGKLAARDLEPFDRKRLELKSPAVAERIIMADAVEPTIEAVIRLARYYKRTKGLAAVVLDYIQLLDGRGTQKQVLDEAVETMQRVARNERIAFLVVSQVKAEVTNREKSAGGPRPTLDDCLGSSAMRIGTKLGLGLFRPWRYCKVPAPKGDYSDYFELANGWPEGRNTFLTEVYPQLVEVNVTKNVVGEAPVTVLCKVDLPSGLFEPFHFSNTVTG